MGDLLIRNVPEDLKRELAEAAHRAGHSVSDEAKQRLKTTTPKMFAPARTGGELVRSIQAALADIPDDDREAFAKIMDEIEAERRTDYGRPVTFGE